MPCQFGQMLKRKMLVFAYCVVVATNTTSELEKQSNGSNEQFFASFII